MLLAPGTLLALVLLAASSPRLDDGDDLVREFERYYRAERPAAQRLEAVEVLRGIDTVAAARALLAAFEDDDFTVRQTAVAVVGECTREEIARFLVDEVLDNRRNARRTLLRAGAAEAAGRIGAALAYEPLVELLDEKDLELRLAALRGLGALGDARACPLLAERAAGADAAIAVEAVRALVAIGEAEPASDAVVAALVHADWRVRAEAIAGVVALRLRDGIAPLIERMRLEEGRLRGDAYDALRTVTMRPLLDDPDTWAAWWERVADTFVLPDPEKVAAARAALEEGGSRYTAGRAKSFLGVDTTSESILFVIDVSSSMETTFGDPARLAATGRTYSSLERLEIVKEELVHTIEGLAETTSFNVLAYARDVRPWKREPVRANVLNKNNAVEWVLELEPLGRLGDAFRARTGLSDDRANEGGTNTHLALMTAFGEPVDDDDRRQPRQFATEPLESDVDTIFFLTDGEPTVGKTVDMREIREEVRRVNAYRGVELHVIYVGSLGGGDFKGLAEENGGVFVSLGG